MKKVAVGVLALVVFGACSSNETDYRDAAKKAIGGKDAETQLGQKFNDITCDTPASKEIGTTFECTATGADDATSYTFTAEIKTKKFVEITGFAPS